MTSANVARLAVGFLLVCLGSWLVPACSRGRLVSGSGHRYGPTTPGGYYVHLEPSIITMSHTQRPQVTVTVEDATGQPVDNIPVIFTSSEGNVTVDTSLTRNGVVTGTYTAPVGSDSPRKAFVVVTVEDFQITVFIDIVPAVYGR